MQFSYIVGNFTYGYSSVRVNAGGFVVLESAASGASSVVIQRNGDAWEVVSVAINGGAATTLLDTSNIPLSTTTHGVGIAWTGETAPVHFVGGDLADFLIGGNESDTLEGGLGNDSLYGSMGSDSILGGDGNDSMRGGDGDDTLLGEVGNDSLIGEAGDDILDGGDGNDTLIGGSGTDFLDGGNGNDIFLDPTGDTIASFESVDIIRLTGGATQGLTASQLQYESGTKTLTVDYDKNGTFGDGSDIVIAFSTAPAAGRFLIANNATFAEIVLRDAPSVVSAAYDASAGVLSVTGANMVAGEAIDVSKLTLTGEGGIIYTLTTPGTTASSDSAFAVTLNAVDKAAVNQILNKIGADSTGATTYSFTAAEDWVNGAGVTGNGVMVINVPAPTVTFATYSGITNVLTVTGTGFVKSNGAGNDIDATKFTFTGEGGATHTLTDTADVEIASSTTFSLTLSATDSAAVELLLNKSGASANDSTTYNLAAAEDWARGADATVTVADLTGNGVTLNAAPIITSNGGGATASINIAENHTAVTTVTATDADSDPLTYSLNGGADAAKLSINATTGALTFVSAPNFEASTDVGADNTYEVIVRASDGTATDDQTLTVTVTDVNETVPPVQPPTQSDALVDGVSVQTTQQTSAGGLTTTTVQIAPVSASRVEDPSTPHKVLADIPLVTDAGGQTLLSTGLPVGIGLQSIAQSSNDLTLRQQLITASQSRITDDTAWQQILSDGIDAYTATVTAPAQVTVRTLVLSAASGSSAPGQPIVITGASGTGENDSTHPNRQEALVIDARSLPAGSVLSLDQVEFAIIIGPVTVTGGAGRNLVLGDGSAQTIILGAEDDILHGGAGDDTVGSHGGNDQLFGDAGNDTVVGGEGNDTLEGGDGNDLLVGGQSDAGTWSFTLNAQHQLVTTFTATTSNLALHASETLTGAWNQSSAALTGYGGITFADQSVDTVEAIALLFQALGQRLPDVAEMNYWANQGLTPQQLAQLAYNAHLDGQAIATSLTAQSADLITWLWGTDAATPALTQAVADYIEHGGSWADVVLAGIRHDTFRGPLEDADGTLTLIQSHSSAEAGWSADTGNDTLTGGDGNDTLVGGSGSDTLDGGDRIDTAVFSTVRSASQLTWSGSILQIGTGEDIDQLTHIERLQFADQKIALDLDGNAGRTMELIATIAPQYLDDLGARGQILALFDSGETLLSLSQLALDLHLIPDNNAELAVTLYRNVLNSQPTDADTQTLTQYIEDHGQADFVATVAGLHLNIDLVGMQQAGVEYV